MRIELTWYSGHNLTGSCGSVLNIDDEYSPVELAGALIDALVDEGADLDVASDVADELVPLTLDEVSEDWIPTPDMKLVKGINTQRANEIGMWSAISIAFPYCQRAYESPVISEEEARVKELTFDERAAIERKIRNAHPWGWYASAAEVFDWALGNGSITKETYDAIRAAHGERMWYYTGD